MTQGEKRHKHIGQTPPPHTPTYILKKKKKRQGHPKQTDRKRKEGGIPNPLSAVSKQVCGGGNGGRERRGWNTNTVQARRGSQCK